MSAKRTAVIVAVAVLAAASGWLSRGLWGGPEPSRADALGGAGPCPGGAEPAYWKAPMDPTYIRDAPGKSPMGMDLVPVCTDARQRESSGIAIDPTLVQSMGVRTAVVQTRDMSRAVRAVGRVAYDERLVSHVHTKVQGWIEELHVEYEGQTVRRGTPLIEIYSPELLGTQEELLVAARYRDMTRESSFSDVRKGGETLFDATRRRLELWDIPDRDIERLLESGTIRKTITLYAPSGGVVTSLMARQGMEVGPSDNLYTIADLSRVWVYADVYEYELPLISEGQTAAVDLSYVPGRTFAGTVAYVYPFLDPKTRTARVRVELENPGLLLKPDMFANVVIQAGTVRDVVAVPEEAVIRSGTRSLAIRALAQGRFEPRTIETGISSDDGWVEVREGLTAGERVVTSGQFLIDSESRLQEAVQRLIAGDEVATPSKGAPHLGQGVRSPSANRSGHEGHDMASMPDAPARD